MASSARLVIFFHSKDEGEPSPDTPRTFLPLKPRLADGADGLRVDGQLSNSKARKKGDRETLPLPLPLTSRVFDLAVVRKAILALSRVGRT
jgi:hypothetical protein